ncbi:MAG: amidohydrolase family protein [Verrucomicrobia bacterium]|nr:amidohydrolase family protein [Verrucomicrobiota bacterium]
MAMRPVDMHVHIVGNGSSCSGCWVRPRGLHRLLAAFMLHHNGLPQNALAGDLDRLYVETLLNFLRTSSLGAAVILAHDDVYDERGHRMEGIGSLYVPNDYVLALARRHPEFLPAVSIHSARPDAMEELERCLAAGAVMMKLLPNSQNIDFNDRRYTRFWERLAESRLPLLAHTGGEHTVPIIRQEWADPRVLERPLQCGVTVIAAHVAGKGSVFDHDYFGAFVGMTRRYPRLYGDLSALNIPFRSQHLRACLHEPLVHRLLHGSDFPVPVMGHWAWMRGLVNWRTFRRLEREPNPLERDYQLKRAMGFPVETFTRIWQLLRQPANRFLEP